MADDNNPKTVPSTEGQTDNKAVNEPVDNINAPLTLTEAEAIVNAPEGQIEAEIEKSKMKKVDPEKIAPDLIALKKQQSKIKAEVKVKADDVKQETKEVETETEKEIIPDKFKDKTPEERLKMFHETEAYSTKLSQKNKDLEARIAELQSVEQKIAELEKASVVKAQTSTAMKLPEYPSQELFYDDPAVYNQKVKEYYDAKLNAMVSPLLGQNWNSQKMDIINKLKDNTKNDIVPFTEVEKEVEKRIKRNPALINQYGLNASTVVYNQLRNEMLPTKIDEVKDKAKEEAKRELQEEAKAMNNTQIMTDDLVTQSRGGKPVELADRLAKGEDPEKVIAAYKEKYKADFQF